jgi:HEAT repeat protein
MKGTMEMKDKFYSFVRIGLFFAIALGLTAGVFAQTSPEELIKQLTGKAQAPEAAQLADSYQKALDYLIPLMAADKVESRYNPQIQLQNLGSYAARPGADAQREAFAKALIQNLDKPQVNGVVKNWFVLQLERVGGAESVEPLAKLLKSDDANLRDYARRALEKNPAPAATDVLLKELAAAKDVNVRIGLINSLGQRKAEKAVADIKSALEDKEVKVACAAVGALADIGNKDSVDTLFSVLEKKSGAVQVKAGQGLVYAGRELIDRHDRAAAGQIFEKLSQALDKPKSKENSLFFLRVAALNGLVACVPDQGVKQVVAMAQDADPKVRAAAVQAARQAPTKDALTALSQLMPKLDADGQIQVLTLLAERGDLSSVKYAKDALKSDNEPVRVAAIQTLTRLGCDEGAGALLELAVGAQGETQKAAREGLARMAGPLVDEALLASAASGKPENRAAAIGLLGERQVSGVAEKLVAYAAEEDEKVSAAALKALGDVASANDVASLAGLLAGAKSVEARKSGEAALKNALGKAADKEAAAKLVVEKLNGAQQPEGKLALIRTLSGAGSVTALKAVTEAAQATDDTVREAGIRALSNWPNFEAGTPLLEVASKADLPMPQYVLAATGVIRLVKESKLAPLDKRTELCLAVLDKARRPDEKKLAIAALGSLPGQQASDRLKKLAQEPEFKVEAGLAAVELAGNMRRTDKDGAKKLAEEIRKLDISPEVNSRADELLKRN